MSKQLLVFRFGRKWSSMDLKNLTFFVGDKMGMSKGQIKRLIEQGAVEVMIHEKET